MNTEWDGMGWVRSDVSSGSVDMFLLKEKQSVRLGSAVLVKEMKEGACKACGEHEEN